MFRNSSSRDEPYLSRIAEINFRPIFILGLHRSGTTLLYELLSMSGSFNILTAYHVLYYDELLTIHLEGTADQTRQELNEWFASLNLRTRLIDNVKMNADMPEEYGMILHAKNGKMAITERNFPLFDQLCRKIQFISDPSRILLLKNPWDFDRFLMVKKRIPEAKFLFIHRNPMHVLNSQVKALQKNWSVTNPYISRLSKAYARIHNTPLLMVFFRLAMDPSSNLHQLVRHFLTRNIVKSMTYYIRNIKSLSKSEYVSLRYEDLCDDPIGHIRRIFNLAGVEPRVAVRFEDHINRRPLRLLPKLEHAEERPPEEIPQRYGLPWLLSSNIGQKAQALTVINSRLQAGNF